MVQAIVINEPGGPEVLKPTPVEVSAPGKGQVRLRQTVIGVNFHDCYVRSGLYKTLELPGIPGLEAVGVVEEAGPGVTGFKPGDRVGYMTRTYGGYAQARVIDADLLVRLPDALDDRTVGATLLRGLTAHMLVRQVFPVRAGHVILVHAAAGGVGRLVCQWAKHLGATVIGTVGSEEKAKIAAASGCDHTILYRTENFVDRVRAITGGRGVDVAYDSVGQDTFLGSLQSLALRGHLVNFGQSSGPIAPFSISLLFDKSSTISRPAVFHYFTGEGRDTMARELFSALEDGIITADHHHDYAFADAAQAHRDLEARKTNGAVLLIA
ncbi:MAG: zinc-binding dehydrogenase [Betaproteobacteria bacterium]|nr:zinc-binding dehydrogenase [Betaproteobacteria bacterium]